jgi:hypothetical protein
MMVGWWWDVSNRVVAGREGQTPLLTFRVMEGVVADRGMGKHSARVSSDEGGMVAGREMGKPLHSRFKRWRRWWQAERGGGGKQREEQTPPLASRATEGGGGRQREGKPLCSPFKRWRGGGGRQREGLVASRERGKPLCSCFEQQRGW